MTLNSLDFLPEHLRQDPLMVKVSEIIDYLTRSGDGVYTREDIIKYNEKILQSRDALNAKGEGFDADTFLYIIDANKYSSYIARDINFPSKEVISHVLPRIYNLKGTERGLKMLMNTLGVDVKIYSWSDIKRARSGSELLTAFKRDFPNIPDINDFGARIVDNEFNFHTDDVNAYGIWSNNNHIYISDRDDNKLYAYIYDTKARDTSKDITLHADNTDPMGIWSDGTTIWVVDNVDRKVYAYTLSTKARNPSEEFNLHRSNTRPRGIWGDASTIWVSDAYTSIYSYNIGNKEFDIDKHIPYTSRERFSGIWSNGNIMWVNNIDTNQLQAYGLQGDTNLSWTRNPNKEIYNESHTHGGVWSNGTIMWILSYSDDYIYAYNLYDSILPEGSELEFNLHIDNASPNDIWSDKTTMWILDNDDNKLYAYTLATKQRDSSKDIVLHADNSSSTCIWSDGTTMYVADDTSTNYKMYAYTLSNGNRDTSEEFSLRSVSGQENQHPRSIIGTNTAIYVYDWSDSRFYHYDKITKINNRGLDITNISDTIYSEDSHVGVWSDGYTIWVAKDYNTTRMRRRPQSDSTKIVAFNISTGLRDYTKSIDLNISNTAPSGLWSDGKVFYVSDFADKKLYVYVPPRGHIRNINGINVSEIPQSTDIWSDGTTMWVLSIYGENKVYAYNISTKMRDESKDINVEYAGRTMWSDGTIMWIGSYGSNVLEAYNLSNRIRDDSNDITLHPNNNGPSGIWSDGITMYVADVWDRKVYAYSATTYTRLTNKEFRIDNQIPNGLWSDGNTMWVSTFSHRTYAYNIFSTRYTANDINLHIDNSQPRDLWSNDGNQMYVVDDNGAFFNEPINGGLPLGSNTPKVFSYVIPGASSIIDECTVYISASPRGNAVFFGLEGEQRLYDVIQSFLWTCVKIKFAPIILTDAFQDPLPAAHIHDEIENPNVTHSILENINLSETPVFNINESIVESLDSTQILDILSFIYEFIETFNLQSQLTIDLGVSLDELMQLAERINLIEISSNIENNISPSSDPFGDSNIIEYGLSSPDNESLSALTESNVATVFGENLWTANNKRNLLLGYKFQRGEYTQRHASLILDALNNTPNTMCISGTTLYVLNDDTAVYYNQKIFAYDLYNNERDPSKDISLDLGNNGPQSIYTDGTTMWVVDVFRTLNNRIYAYNIETKVRDTIKEINSLDNYPSHNFSGGIFGINSDLYVASVNSSDNAYNRIAKFNVIEEDRQSIRLDPINSNPDGLCSDGDTIWTLDETDLKIYGYDKNIGRIDRDKEISLHADNTHARDIVKYGDILLVLDNSDVKVYAYKISTKRRNTSKEFNLVTYTEVEGSRNISYLISNIWTDGITLWSRNVALNRSAVALAYTLSNGTRDTDKDFVFEDEDSINSVHTNLDHNNETLWITYASKVYAYQLPSNHGIRDESQDIDIRSISDSRPSLTAFGSVDGLWIDDIGEFLYIFNVNHNKIYVWNILLNEEVPSKEISIAATINNSLISDGTTIWIIDRSSTTLLAYRLSDGAYNLSKDIRLNASNGNARGVATDKTTIWVLDRDDAKLYAYNILTKLHDPSKDFSYSATDIPSASNIWSDGVTVWIISLLEDNTTAWAYNLSNGTRDADKDFTYSKHGKVIRNIVSNGITVWFSDDKAFQNTSDSKLYAYKINTAKNRDRSKDLQLGHINTSQCRGLWIENNIMWSLIPVISGRAGVTYTLDGYEISPYSLYTPRNEPSEDIKLISNNNSAKDIWSDGINMYVYNNGSTQSDQKIYRYPLDNSISRVTSHDITFTPRLYNDPDASGIKRTNSFYGLLIYENIIFISTRNETELSNVSKLLFSDMNGNRLDYYNVVQSREPFVRDDTRDVKLIPDDLPITPLGRSILLDDETISPSGMFIMDEYAYVIDFNNNHIDGKNIIYRYNVYTRKRDETFNIFLYDENSQPVGLWSDGVTMWVSNKVTRISAYTLSTGARNIPQDIVYINSSNKHLDIWCNGTTMWVINESTSKIEAYTLSGATRDLDNDIIITVKYPYSLCGHSYNNNAWNTLWINDADKIIAYDTITKARDEEKDIEYHNRHVDILGMYMYKNTFYIMENFVKIVDEDKNITLYTDDIPSLPAKGIWADDTTLWAANDVSLADTIYAFNRETKLRDSSKDIALHTNNTNPGCITFDNNDVLVVDTYDQKIYNYTYNRLVNGTRLPEKEFNFYSENINAYDIWSDGVTLWVNDIVDRKIYAYDLATGIRDEDKEFNLHIDNGSARCIWSDGITMFVVDSVDRKVYAYVLDTGDRDTTKEFNLHAYNTGSKGVWSNGITMWITDSVDKKVYAYTMSDGSRDSLKEFYLDEDNSDPYDIWSDGFVMLVADATSNKVFAYNLNLLPSGIRDTTKEFNYYSSNDRSVGLWSNETTLWVLDQRLTVFAYNLSDGSRDTTKQFNLYSGNLNCFGLWSNGTVVYVADRGQNKMYAYSLETSTLGTRLTNLEFNLDTNNTHAIDIWSDGTTMWVLDDTDNKAYAYTLSTKLRDASKDVTLDSANSNPTGIESSNGILWVLDRIDKKVYGYNLSDGSRNIEHDFNISSVQSANAQNIWSDGSLIYISDWGNDRVYVYTLYTDIRNEEKDFNLDVGNTDARGVWSNGTILWVVDRVDSKVYAYALNLRPNGYNPLKDFSFDVENRHPIDMATNSHILWVLDSFDRHVYVYNLKSKLRLEHKEFDLDSDNQHPRGIYHFNNLLYVNDTITNKVYAYNLDGVRLPDEEYNLDLNNNNVLSMSKIDDTIYALDSIDNIAYAYTGYKKEIGVPVIKNFNSLHNDNQHNAGMWSDGTTIWVPDSNDNKVYAYTLLTGDRDTTKEFNLHADNSNSRGIWSDGTTIWITDNNTSRQVYAYNFSDYARKSSHDFILDVLNSNPRGIWFNSNTIYCADEGTDKIYAYDKPNFTSINTANWILTNNVFTDMTGMWSDGTTIWLSDRNNISNADTIYAYNISTRLRDSSKDITLHLDNQYPISIWSDGTIIYVLNTDSSSHIYAYNLFDGTRNISEEFTPPIISSRFYVGITGDDTYIYLFNTNGILYKYNKTTKVNVPSQNINIPLPLYLLTIRIDCWLEGTTLWVSDAGYTSIRSYDISTRTRDASKDINLHANNRHTVGIWSDGLVFYAVDSFDNIIYVYEREIVPDRNQTKDITLNSTNNAVRDIWSDGICMWAIDYNNKVFVYKLSDGTRDVSKEFNLDTTTSYVYGIWSDRTTIYISNITATSVYAYDIVTRITREIYNRLINVYDVRYTHNKFGYLGRDKEEDIKIARPNNNSTYESDSHYMYIDGAYIYLCDYVDTKIYVYTLADGIKYSGKDITLHSDNANPRGIWSNGTTIYVADDVDNKIYAYILSDGTRNSSKDITLHLDNADPKGIWSDDITMWVADNIDNKLYAYTLNDGTRDITKDFNLHTDNGSALSIWSNGITMWITDNADNKVYAYTLSDGTRDTDKEEDISEKYFSGTDTHLYFYDIPNNDLVAYAIKSYTKHLDTRLSYSGSGNFAQQIRNTGSHYGPALGTYISSLSLHLENTGTTGMWSDGITMYISDHTDSKVYAYTLATGMRNINKEFNIIPTSGITSDGTTLWAVANNNYTLTAYTLASNGADVVRNTSKDIIMVDRANDISNDGTTIWTINRRNTSMRAYNISTRNRDSSKEFALHIDNQEPSSMHNSNSHPSALQPTEGVMWVADNVDNKVYAYMLDTGERDATKEFSFHADNIATTSMWSNGNTLWVLDGFHDRLFAYNLDYRHGDLPDYHISASKDNSFYKGKNLGYYKHDVDVDLHIDNAMPLDCYADKEEGLIWVLDYNDTKLYCYGLTSKLRESSRDIDLYADNADPSGVWGDDSYIWVADATDNKLYAYNKTNGNRVITADKPITNNNASGLWSDGKLFYVPDFVDKKIYTYPSSVVDVNTYYHHNILEHNSIWFNNTHIYITGYDPTNNVRGILAYHRPENRSNNMIRDLTKDIVSTQILGGMFSDGITIWVRALSNVNAYNLSTRLRDRSKDFRLNHTSFGFYTDGTTLWSVNRSTHKVEASVLSSKVRDTAKDIVLDSNNIHPGGIWFDGNLFWVSDENDNKLYAYTNPNTGTSVRSQSNDISYPADLHIIDIFSDGYIMYMSNLPRHPNEFSALTRQLISIVSPNVRPVHYDITLHPSNSTPYGLYGLNDYIYVIDSYYNKLFVYNKYTGERNENKEFDFHYSVFSPIGLTGYDNNILVTYFYSDGVYTYDLNTHATSPKGLWSNEDIMWLTDSKEDSAIAYSLPDKNRLYNDDYELNLPENVVGIWSNNTTLWVAVKDSRQLLAYDILGNIHNSQNINLASDNDSALGMWFDGVNVRVFNRNDRKIYAYTLSNGIRNLTKELDITPNRIAYVDIWSDGNTLWVLESQIKRLYAYNLNTGIANATNDIIISIGDSPLCVSSDGTTMWVLDNSDHKMYAYTLSTKQRDSSKDITLYIENSNSVGMTFDQNILWVVDNVDRKVYAYDTITRDRIPSRDFDLHEDNRDPRGIISNGVALWVADIHDNKLYAYEFLYRDIRKDIYLPLDSKPIDLYSDNDNLWVLCDKELVYSYPLPVVSPSYLLGVRHVSKELTLHVNNTNSTGIWSDGTHMWVNDFFDTKVYAYDLETRKRDTRLEFNIEVSASGGSLWSDGNTMWFLNEVSGSLSPSALYAYNLYGDIYARNTNREYNYHADNANAFGIWSNEVTMYVADRSDNKIYAYAMSETALTRDSIKDIILHADNNHVIDIWSDNETMWVSDSNDNKVYAYTLSTKQRNIEKEFDYHSDNADARGGIWSDGITMWVSDLRDKKIYAYNLMSKTRDINKEFSLHVDHIFPTYMWSDGTTMWVSDLISSPIKLYAYNISDGSRDETKEFNLVSDNANISGMWSNGNIIWVSDNQDNKLYAYSATQNFGVRDTTKDIAGLDRQARGCWSNGTTMWVGYYTQPTIKAYVLSSGTRDSSKDITVSSLNNNISGLWSDGVTMWVLDYVDYKVYAYDLSTSIRDEDKEFNLHVDNTRPSDIWSDGEIFYVNDWEDDKIYAYTNDYFSARDNTKEFVLKENTIPKGLWGMDDSYMFVENNSNNRIDAYRKTDNVASIYSDNSNGVLTLINVRYEFDPTKDGDIISDKDSPGLWGNSNKIIYTR